MELGQLGNDAWKIAQEILGYLNFSSGAPDPAFLRNVNDLFGRIESSRQRDAPTWQTFGHVLLAALEQLDGKSDAFCRVEQAKAVLHTVFDATLPAFRNHHRDLLFHQTEERLFQPLFVGRVCEAVLQQGGPWDESDRIVRGALDQLNDYLGHRPVAVLETEQKIQPYAHEYVRPIPLYIRGAGVGVGRYRELLEKALEILETTDSALLFQAWFDPELLDELALDPRAFDFDHPVGKRPNYLYGQWDPDRLDNSGRCRRFVVQQVALDAMLARVENCGELPSEEVLFEAAAVLAGTMLMGSGVSGNRPDAHSSDATLATLVQHIAAYRDTFYEQLIARLSGPHAQRLRAEAATLRQPFGGARQDFNQHLARRRAEQLQHVQLAQIFARMGYTDAAARQARVVPVASARMKCDLQCRLATAEFELERGRLEAAAALLPELEDLLHRAIECGAIVDPWNILGFGAQYSLFPAVENSVHDHRIDELIDLLGDIFGLYVQLLKAAAAAGNDPLYGKLAEGLDRLARWWDQFASVEVSAVEGISGRETGQSVEHVTTALRAWHEAGTAAGDVAFWRRHVEKFRSAKTYALVVEALLQQRDPVAAMALLIQWLSQADSISLIEEDYSFHDLAFCWMEDLWQPKKPPGADSPAEDLALEHRWALARKFLDYAEANAGELWEVPRFELADEEAEADDEPQDEEEDEVDNLFSAAYEEVTYRDSTDDGFEGEMLEGGHDATDFELVHEAERIVDRLAMHSTLARLWKLAAVASSPIAGAEHRREEVLSGWLRRATANRRRLAELLTAVHRYRIPAPRGNYEALVEYDRRRGVKDMLLEQIIAACVETADAGRVIRAAGGRLDEAGEHDLEASEAWEEPAGKVLRGVLRDDVAAVRNALPDLIDALLEQPLLYVALARGGNPQRIVSSRSIQRLLHRLLEYLPRLGLLQETAGLIETAQEMELDHPVGQGAITEFDQMFRTGCTAIVRCLVVSSEDWYRTKAGDSTAESDVELIPLLEQTTEVLLRCWLAHSRGVRLSVLETVGDERRFRTLKRFIERYGADLFTQRFMGLNNLSAILHQGVDAYLDALAEEPDAEEFRLLADLGGELSRADAIRHLEVILEAVVENYSEYIDYNSTTTQSDRGEMLYTLLDFLRLRASCDRVAWNLQPVMLAHDVLVRGGRDEAAAVWREAVARRTGEIADDHLRRFGRLVKKHGMRLPSIADRLAERFVRPLDIDRLCALVRPAIDELHGGGEPEHFQRLEEEIEEFTAELSGTGFEVPAWLDALQSEVEDALAEETEEDDLLDPHVDVPQVRLSVEEARRQVEAMGADE